MTRWRKLDIRMILTNWILAFTAFTQVALAALDGFSVENLSVKSIHRTNDDTHVFFVAHAGSGGQALCTTAVDGMQPELRVKTEAKGGVAVRFEFQNGPLNFNVYREIHLVGQPTRQRNQ